LPTCVPFFLATCTPLAQRNVALDRLTVETVVNSSIDPGRPGCRSGLAIPAIHQSERRLGNASSLSLSTFAWIQALGPQRHDVCLDTSTLASPRRRWNGSTVPRQPRHPVFLLTAFCSARGLMRPDWPGSGPPCILHGHLGFGFFKAARVCSPPFDCSATPSPERGPLVLRESISKAPGLANKIASVYSAVR